MTAEIKESMEKDNGELFSPKGIGSPYSLDSLINSKEPSMLSTEPADIDNNPIAIKGQYNKFELK